MLRKFLIAWRFVRDLRFDERYEEIPWLLNDQEQLQRFMLSPTGVKFRANLKNFAISRALSAVRKPADPLYYMGTTYGVQLTNFYIDRHLPMAERERDIAGQSDEATAQFLDETT